MRTKAGSLDKISQGLNLRTLNYLLTVGDSSLSHGKSHYFERRKSYGETVEMADGGLWPTWRRGLADFSDNSEMLGKVKIVTNRSPMTNESLGLTRRNGVRTFES